MANLRVALMAVGLGLSAAFLSVPASAQPWNWSWAQCGTDASDIDAIQATVGKLLDEDPVGANRTWSSTSGHSGRVYLLSGGAKAGSDEGNVRITRLIDGQEKTLFTFKYRKTPHKGWASCG